MQRHAGSNYHHKRLRGRITNWSDDRGFGFIVPSGGGTQAFAHISSFVNRRRRPAANDLVTYKLVTDSKGRARAHEIQFVGDRLKPDHYERSVWRSLVVAAGFFGLLLTAVAMGVLPAHVLPMYFVTSALAFMMYWHDKSAARRSRWRTAESTLHAIGLIGGWPGSLVAMQVFRHKSSKASFRRTFWMTVLMNCAALVWLGSPHGATVVARILAAS